MPEDYRENINCFCLATVAACSERKTLAFSMATSSLLKSAFGSSGIFGNFMGSGGEGISLLITISPSMATHHISRLKIN